MRTKLIHIFTHSPNLHKKDLISKPDPPRTSIESDSNHAIKLDKYPYWVIFPTKDWHVQMAEETLLRTDEYLIECWRPINT